VSIGWEDMLIIGVPIIYINTVYDTKLLCTQPINAHTAAELLCTDHDHNHAATMPAAATSPVKSGYYGENGKQKRVRAAELFTCAFSYFQLYRLVDALPNGPTG
jgi:hypothetical protein